MSMRSFQRRPNLCQGRDTDSLATLCVFLISPLNTKNRESPWKVRRNVKVWYGLIRYERRYDDEVCTFSMTCASTSAQVHCRAAWVKAMTHVVKGQPNADQALVLPLSCSFPLLTLQKTLQHILLELITMTSKDVQHLKGPWRTWVTALSKWCQARTCHDLLGAILGESCTSRNKDIAWELHAIVCRYA